MNLLPLSLPGIMRRKRVLRLGRNSMSVDIGTRLGSLEISALLGKGGMGILGSRWRIRIGFDTTWMHEVALPSPTLAFRKVIYDPRLQRSLISRALDETIAKLEELAVSRAGSEINVLIATFVSFLRDHFSEFHFTFTRSPAKCIHSTALLDQHSALFKFNVSR